MARLRIKIKDIEIKIETDRHLLQEVGIELWRSTVKDFERVHPLKPNQLLKELIEGVEALRRSQSWLYTFQEDPLELIKKVEDIINLCKKYPNETIYIDWGTHI
jgi:hypothetical protein